MGENSGLVKTGERHFKVRGVVPVLWLSEDRKNHAAKHRRERTNVSMTGRPEAILISDSVGASPVKRVLRISKEIHVWKEVGKPQGIRHWIKYRPSLGDNLVGRNCRRLRFGVEIELRQLDGTSGSFRSHHRRLS